jgi:hypothetical protein
MLQAGSETLHLYIHILVNTVHRKADKTGCSSYRDRHCHHRHTKSKVLSRSTLHVGKITEDHGVDFDIITDEVQGVSDKRFRPSTK